jgi:hypothetical protein
MMKWQNTTEMCTFEGEPICSWATQKIYGRVARWLIFKPKNLNLGKFCRALDGKMLIYFMAIWNIFWHLWYCMTIWYSLYSFGTFFRLTTLIYGAICKNFKVNIYLIFFYHVIIGKMSLISSVGVRGSGMEGGCVPMSACIRARD